MYFLYSLPVFLCHHLEWKQKKSNDAKYFSSKNFLVESRDTKGSTHFQIRLLKGSVATFAREKWEKGDIVVIKLKSLKGNDLEVGI